MRPVFVILTLFVAVSCFAQKSNDLVIDYANGTKVKEIIVDLSKPLNIELKNCDKTKTKKFVLEISYKGADMPAVNLECNKKTPVPLRFIDTKGKASATFTLKADEEEKDDKKMTVEFYVKPNGEMGPTESGGADDTPVKKPENKKPLPDYNFDFISPRFLISGYTPTMDCRYPVLTYSACCNSTGLHFEPGDSNQDALRYYTRFSKNNGVTFLIKDFNTLKYDITVSSEYENNFTDMPAMIKAVYTLMAPAGFVESAQTDSLLEELQLELSKIVKLNKDLKKYLEKKMQDDCINSDELEKAKMEYDSTIRKAFGIAPDDPLVFTTVYDRAKAAEIANGKVTNPNYDFNKEIQDLYTLPVTPDSLVNETRKLVNFLFNTRFEYQYNVPKLENADAIVFTVNLKPKQGMTGSIYVVDQKIRVPIRYGMKVDFSTGLYYSSIRSNTYALKNVYDATKPDSLIGKDIVNEQGGEKGRTGGVTALMHVYPRLGSFQPAFTFGVGGSLDLNYSLLFGGSLLFGRENRFGLSAGLNFSSIKVISNKYYDNGVLIRQKPDVSTVDTYNKMKRGFFMSFTYSLGLTKKTQEVSTGAGPAQPAPANTDQGSGGDTGNAKADSGGGDSGQPDNSGKAKTKTKS
jgi:hypothetical protein